MADRPFFAIEGEGYTTEADVRPHNRLSLDLAEIRDSLSQLPPDFGHALNRYAFGRHFNWRDAAHSLAYFADNYQGRMPRTLPGMLVLESDPSFQHRFITGALMGVGPFEGGGQRRSAPDAARIAAIESGLLAVVLNWCRLELTEASIRGPKDGNWSLASGSPKNWNELFAFWWGVEGEHSLHAELSRIAERFALPDHPTKKLTAVLAKGQPELIAKRWSDENAAEVRQILDQASLLLLLDRAADLDSANAAGSETALAAHAALKGAWLAAGDGMARADETAAKALHEEIMRGKAAPAATAIKQAVAAAADKLGLAPASFGKAL